MLRFPFLWVSIGALAILISHAQTGPLRGSARLEEPKAAPRLQAVPQPYEQVSFQRDGIEIARFHFGPALKRPFVFPLVGPSGRALMRMGHPHDPITHSHHNSVWISHNDVAGVSFWADTGKKTGHIVASTRREIDRRRHRSIRHVAQSLDRGCDQKMLLTERRKIDGATSRQGGMAARSSICNSRSANNEVTLGKSAVRHDRRAHGEVDRRQ